MDNTDKQECNLTVNQLEFCIQYNNTGNARQSYVKAFSTQNMNTAGVQGCRLLKKPNIIDKLHELQEKTILIPGENEYKRIETYLLGLINDVKIGKTSVGVRAAELYMKLKGYGKDVLEVVNANPLDILNTAGKSKSANDSEHIVN